MSITTPELKRIRISDDFWAPRLETLRAVTLPTQYQHLETTGRLAALDPDHKPGDPDSHHKFWDSDIAKWMEAAAYSIATQPDPELEDNLQRTVDALGRLQCEDGYLNNWFTKVYPEKRWTNLRDDHELYCAGHLIEAAVAHHRTTGRSDFLDIITRYVDLIDSVFGQGEHQKHGYPGHEEIELALVKLFHVTHDRKHLDLARYFIDERGRHPNYFAEEAKQRGDNPDSQWGGLGYYQAQLPVRKQNIAEGHAVRAMYLSAGMTDIWSHTGDKSIDQAVAALWENVCTRQMYLTGSVGAAGHGERFTFDYDLPEETSYCETCAAIGLVFWNHRILGNTGDRRYGDVIERALYNGVLSGISLSGDRYFYVNPLASLGDHHRQDWFGCACCPPNIARLLASLGQYVYSEGEDAWIHLFVSGSGQLAVGGHTITLTQKTHYPWDGAVRIGVEVDGSVTCGINVRLPGWCREVGLVVNGEAVDVEAIDRKGYAHIDREWRSGDVIEIELPMPVERVYANPCVRMANGKVALQRGPIVYCLEGTDNNISPLNRIGLPRSASISTEHQSDLLGGVTTLSGECFVASTGVDALYSQDSPTVTGHAFTAVPYYAWDNREAGHMQVWLRESDS
jgi:DUF1680 family protein